jgi:hypothetical protein
MHNDFSYLLINIILSFTSSLAYFISDYQERFKDDSLNSLTLLDYNNTTTINLEMKTSTSSEYSSSSSSKNINKLNEIKISKEKVEILEHIKRFINESDV